MKDIKMYSGIIPAFYACYNENGDVSAEGTRAMAQYLMDKGVTGLYVCGSSGECIYQSMEERKLILENVMAVCRGKITVIAHVAANNTRDSQELARHAESLGVDAIAAIPPIYFHLPDRAIEKYWNDISAAAPNTDFIIYNIPQLAGVSLNSGLLRNMLKNPRVIGVKNSSAPTQDIEMWRDEGAIVFNGPDEQLLSGLAAGAIGAIGGTYAVMPELYLKLFSLFNENKIREARDIQDTCCHIIYKMVSGYGNLYAMMKRIIVLNGGPNGGSVREPLLGLNEADEAIAAECAKEIRDAIAKYC